jgi:hypothetical protein
VPRSCNEWRGCDPAAGANSRLVPPGPAWSREVLSRRAG